MRIEAKNLVKIYGDRSVVNDVTFYMDKGEVVCLLGPNGAGKTTTFYMIVGLVKPNTGSVFIDDKESVLDEVSTYGINCICMGNSKKYQSFCNWHQVLQYIKEEYHG